MNPLPDYPNYGYWRALILEQHSGLLSWVAFVGAMLLLWLLWRKLFKRFEVALVFGSVGLFYFSICSVKLGWALLPILYILPLSVLFDDTIRKKIELWDIQNTLVWALILRLPNLILEQPWYDETVTAAFTQIAPSNIFALGGDTHPPLFYLPFWVVSHFLGTSPIVLRLPSLVFGVLTVYLMHRLTIALGFNRNTALMAAMLVAVMPGAIRYSNEARGYAQLTAMVFLMAIAVLENRPRWFAGAATVTILTQNMGYVYVGCIGLVGFLWYIHQTKILSLEPIPGGYNYWNFGPFRFYWQVKDKQWFYATAAVAAVGLLWLPFMFRQFQSVSSGWWVVFAAGAIPRPLFSMTVGTRIPEPYILQILAVVWVITLLSLLALKKWFFTTRGNLWVAMCVGPMAIGALVSLITPVYVDRAFLPSALGFLIPWAYVITERKAFERVAAAGLLLPTIGIALIAYYAPDNEVRQDWRARLSSGCGDAPVVFNTSMSTYFLARYYLPEREIIAWDGANDINLFLPLSVKLAMNVEMMHTPPEGEVCILDLDTPISRQEERMFNAVLTSGHERTVLSHVEAMDITVSAVRVP